MICCFNVTPLYLSETLSRPKPHGRPLVHIIRNYYISNEQTQSQVIICELWVITLEHKICVYEVIRSAFVEFLIDILFCLFGIKNSILEEIFVNISS
jgi:hypothetical protein